MSNEKDFVIKNGVLEKYKGTGGDVIIPDGVKSIGHAFYYCTSLTSVLIPEGVKEIGNFTFYGCKALQYVTIPDSVTHIGESAFGDCQSLTSISIPDSVSSFGGPVFEKHTKVSIRETENPKHTLKKDACLVCDGVLVQYVGGYQNVIIPDCVKSIGNNAFEYRTSVKQVIIPDGVTNIGSSAFSNCQNLTDIIIPRSVTNIGNSVFCECNSLKSIVIPDGITRIEDFTFEGCKSLKNISIPGGIAHIGNRAFKYCSSLTSFNMPNSLTHIGDSAFSGCSSLRAFNLPNTLTHIGAYAFSGCSSVKNIDIPDRVTSIGGCAFANCKSLKSVTIPSSVTSCGRFDRCNDVENIRLLSTHQEGTERQTSIIRNISGSDIFDAKSKSAIQAVYAPECLISEIENSKMKFALIKGFLEEQEATQNEEAKLAYSDYMYKQKKRVLPLIFAEDRVESLKIYVDAKKVTKANYEKDFLLPAQEAKAQQCVAFLMDWIGRNVSIQDVEKQFEKELNKNPLSLTELKKIWNFEVSKKGTAKITGYKGTDTTIEIPQKIGDYTVTGLSEELFCPSKKQLSKKFAAIREQITKVVIPEGIKSIGDKAFCGCKALQKITIPKSVSKIGNGAVAACPALTEIIVSADSKHFSSDEYGMLYDKSKTLLIRGSADEAAVALIPQSVTSIAHSAFYGLSTLAKITLPDQIISIEDQAFFECKHLTNITLPSSLERIGSQAFYECSSLKRIDIPDSVKDLGEEAFYQCEKLTKVKLSSSLSFIAERTFMYCHKLRSIDIPGNVQRIGSCAFYACADMEKAVLSEGVEVVEKDAFAWSRELTEVTLPASLTTIGPRAFPLTDLKLSGKIRGIPGSYAEKYAKKYDIRFVALSGTL